MSKAEAILIQIVLAPLIGTLIVIALGNSDRVASFLLTYYIVFIVLSVLRGLLKSK